MAWYDSVVDTVSGAASSLFGGSSTPSTPQSTGGNPYGNMQSTLQNYQKQQSSGGIADILSGLGSSALGGITNMFQDDKGNLDYARILGAAGAGADALGLFGSTPQQKSGYQGKIPTYTASRMQVPNTYDPARRPGSGGQRYFTDVSFSGGDLSGQAAGLEALNRANLAAQNRAGQQLAPIRAAEDAAKAAKVVKAAAAQQTAAPAAATPPAQAAQAAQLASALGNRGGTMLGGGNLQGSGVVTSNNPAAAQAFNQLSPLAQVALLGGAVATPAKGFAQGGIAQFTAGRRVDAPDSSDSPMQKVANIRSNKPITTRTMPNGKKGLFQGNVFLGYADEGVSGSDLTSDAMEQLNRLTGTISKGFDAINPFQEGGMAELKNPQYLDGATDGMADEIDASIEGEQPAALSDGEFVIPADVVSHLGNGNSDAGAKVLEKMMSRVRKERTGSTKQGKEIDPEEFLPA